MPAYVIYNQTEMIDPDAWAEYGANVREGLAKFGARVIASVPDPTILEGEWSGIHNVIIEFPDRETIDRWYISDEYKPQLALRLKAARGNLIVLDGV
jgi:uncharacterized protein (DUF1330 family)